MDDQTSLEIKYQIKIILAGDGGVGKTCLANRFCYDSFNIDTRLTIGLSFNTYYVNAIENDSIIRIGGSIWDFGGQDRFRPLIPQFIAGTHGIIMIFDMTAPHTLFNLYEQWLPLLDRNAGNVPKILVGTKLDLVDETSGVSKQIIKEYQEKLGCKMTILTSSKTGSNVDDVFFQIMKNVAQNLNPDIDIKELDD